MIGRRVELPGSDPHVYFYLRFFFLIFFSIFDVNNMHVGAQTKEQIEKDPDLKELISKAKTTKDSLRILSHYNATGQI